MLTDHIHKKLLQFLGHSPTSGQNFLLKSLSNFIVTKNPDEIFLIKGYAGTGKTTVIKALVCYLREIKHRCVLLAPTGRAAKVMNSYTNHPAFTIHKKIYRQKSSKDGFGQFILDKNLHKNTFFVVDEASMIANGSNDISIFGTGRLLDDLLEYVYSGENCKLVLIGDTAQLPPVKLDISPALDKRVLEKQGFSVIENLLTEVLRQEEAQGVLENATYIRQMIAKKRTGYPELTLKGFNDIHALAGTNLIETISTSYDKYGYENTIIICRSNKRANAYNLGIRNQILWREDEIATGDYIMIVKNNYYWPQYYEESGIDFIANGDIAKITRIKKIQELYGFRFADVEIELVDYNNTCMEVKILLDTLTSETASLSSDDNKTLFYAILEDYMDLKPKKKQYDNVKENPFFNALQIKFAYAVTCHKAQGGQWHTVYIDQGYITDEMLTTDYLRWLYTAFTRATHQLYLMNFKKEFFKDAMME